MSFGSWLVGLVFLGIVCLIAKLVQDNRGDSDRGQSEETTRDDDDPRRYTEGDMYGAMWFGSQLDKDDPFF